MHPSLRSPVKQNDHVKYEFIEKLLRHPAQDSTRKTLQEMANLYQELLEKNLTNSSAQGAVNSIMMRGDGNYGSESPLCLNTNQSIQVITDQRKAAINVNSQNMLIQGGDSVYKDNIDGKPRIKEMRGSVQLDVISKMQMNAASSKVAQQSET